MDGVLTRKQPATFPTRRLAPLYFELQLIAHMAKATTQSISEEKLIFVEEIGRYMEETGSPRIAGRIVGWLLICEPSHQSFSDLVQALGASKGSISNMTRLLLEFDLIEHYSLPGDRQTYFRIRTGAWQRVMRRQMSVMGDLRRTADKGLEILNRENPDGNHWRLQEMGRFYGFISGKIPELLSEYEDEIAD